MFSISNWGIALAFFGVLILVIALSLIIYFRDYLGVYKSPKVVLSVAIPGLFYGEYKIWQILLMDINGTHQLNWPDLAIIAMLIGYGFLLIGFGVAIKLYGKQWWIRQHYAFRSSWGPILTLGSSESSLFSITWCSTSYFKDNDPIHFINLNNSFKFNVRPFIPSLHSSIAQFNSIDLLSKDTTQISPKIPLMYQIPGDKEVFSVNPQWFRNGDNTLSILVLGDLHAGGDDVQPFITCLSQHLPQSAFVLTLGDIISNAQSMSQWKTYFGQFHTLLPKIPFIYLPGNHDGYSKARSKIWRTLLNQPYSDASDGGYFSFTKNGCHFILLDNYNKSGQFVGISEKETRWLDSELKMAQENPKILHVFLCLHNPPFSTGNDGCDPVLGPFFLSVISHYSKICAIFSGHAHFYQRFTYSIPFSTPSRKVHFLILGGGGKLGREVLSRWDPGPYRWSSDGFQSTPKFIPRKRNNHRRNDTFIAQYHQKSVLSHNFMRLNIDGSSIRYQIYDWTNQIIEEFE